LPLNSVCACLTRSTQSRHAGISPVTPSKPSHPRNLPIRNIYRQKWWSSSIIFALVAGLDTIVVVRDEFATSNSDLQSEFSSQWRVWVARQWSTGQANTSLPTDKRATPRKDGICELAGNLQTSCCQVTCRLWPAVAVPRAPTRGQASPTLYCCWRSERMSRW
jgi:hypothetical protein